MTIQHTPETLRHKYELEVQSIESQMPRHERWGSGAYYRHRLEMYRQFIAELTAIINEKEADK